MNRQEPLYNKQGYKSSPVGGIMPMMKSEEVHRRGSDDSISYGMDLPQKYQNAVDCLVHCEFIITNLQQEVTNKDRLIKSLEERIVQMSIELATAKAIEDEHALMKRRLSDFSTNEKQQQDSAQFRGRPSRSEDAVLKVNYVPISVRTKGDTTANEDSKLDDSRSCKSSDDVEFFSWPEAQEDKRPENFDTAQQLETRRHPEPKRRGGFRLPNLGKRWEAETSDYTSEMKAAYLDSSQRSTVSNSSGIFTNESSSDCYSGSSIFSLRSTRQASSTSLKEEFPRRNRGNRRSSLDDAIRPTRRLSSLGQILGLQRSESTPTQHNLAATTACERPRRIYHEDTKHDLEELFGDNVVFPVTSDDCLLGLIRKKSDESVTVPMEISARINKNNETWPDFGLDPYDG